jgi:hypothetical protein
LLFRKGIACLAYILKAHPDVNVGSMYFQKAITGKRFAVTARTQGEVSFIVKQ